MALPQLNFFLCWCLLVKFDATCYLTLDTHNQGLASAFRTLANFADFSGKTADSSSRFEFLSAESIIRIPSLKVPLAPVGCSAYIVTWDRTMNTNQIELQLYLEEDRHHLESMTIQDGTVLIQDVHVVVSC